MAGREEASREERVERPRTPEESAVARAKADAWIEGKKREQVRVNLGITEGELRLLTGDYDDTNKMEPDEPANDTGDGIGETSAA
jgi:hypothetical protein